jgi:hypothetical protein
MKNKILYIEDNDQNFYRVNFILTSKWFDVTLIYNGLDGIIPADKRIFIIE